MGNCGDKLIGQAMAHQQALGKHIPDEALHELPIEGQVSYTQTEAKVNEAVASHGDPNYAMSKEEAQDNTLMGKVRKDFGVLKNEGLSFWKPDGIIGNFHQPLMKVLKAHLEQYPNRDNFSEFSKAVKPVIKALRANVASLPIEKQKYANNYLDSWERGGTLYTSQRNFNIFMKMANNVIGGWAKGNLKISLGNILELDKPVGIYGTKATAQGWQKLISETKGNIFKKIPRLEADGVYGSGHHEAKGPVGKVLSNLNEPSEVMLRNIAYLSAEAAGKPGWHGLEHVAFVHQPGNEPLIYHYGGKESIPLMRFALEGQKMYYGMGKNAFEQMAKGNLNPMKNFLLYNATTLAKGGAVGAIPGWVWMLIGSDNADEWKKKINSLPGVNLIQKTTGADVGQISNNNDIGLTPGLQWIMMATELGKAMGQGGKLMNDIHDHSLNTMGWRAMEIAGLASQVTPYQAPLSVVKVISALRKNAEETGRVTPDARVAGKAALKAIGAPVGE